MSMIEMLSSAALRRGFMASFSKHADSIRMLAFAPIRIVHPLGICGAFITLGAPAQLAHVTRISTPVHAVKINVGMMDMDPSNEDALAFGVHAGAGGVSMRAGLNGPLWDALARGLVLSDSRWGLSVPAVLGAIGALQAASRLYKRCEDMDQNLAMSFNAGPGGLWLRLGRKQLINVDLEHLLGVTWCHGEEAAKVDPRGHRMARLDEDEREVKVAIDGVHYHLTGELEHRARRAGPMLLERTFIWRYQVTTSDPNGWTRSGGMAFDRPITISELFAKLFCDDFMHHIIYEAQRKQEAASGQVQE